MAVVGVGEVVGAVDVVGEVDVRAVHRRDQRAEAPRVPAGTVEIEAPPEIPRVVAGSPLLKMLPLVMVVAMVGMVALMISSGAAANPMTLLFPAMMVVSMLGMFAGGGRGGGPKTAELDESRKDYLGYLSSLRDRVRATARAQRESLVWSHPSPSALWTCAGTARMWERRADDDDFLHVRVGVGDQRLATRLVSPETGPPEDLEPVCAAQLRFFVRTHSIVRDLPTAVSLRAFSVIRFEGDGSHVRGVLRSMLLQACMFHGPDDVLVVVVADPQKAADWDWVKWLPHHRDTEGRDSAGARRMTFRTVAEASTILSASPRESAGPIGSGRSRRHVLMVSAGGVPDVENLGACAADESVTVFDLCAEVPAPGEDRTLVLVLDGGGIGARGRVGVEMFGTADSMDVVTATAAAKSLSPYRTPGGAGATELSSTRFDSWDRLPGMADPATLDPSSSWVARSGRARLRVPFGTDTDGRVVELDLKEAAEGGMGPHGLCIGATGSGKSELLRTIVLGLVATHPPDVLNLVLVDFKGGATFLGLESAPHVAAVITNLAEESGMVERMRDALAGEMNRRQELLRAAGNFANVTEYSRARDGGAQLPPLPALFVVVDEFSELLTRFPEFADLFLAIGRLGRSLHIHLLLASQRLDEGRLRGLDSHLSYRIGLKTFSATESRSVLGVADAHHLTGGPGAGYLKTDSSDLVRFDAAYVSGPYTPGAASSSVLPGAAPSAGVCLFSTLPVSPTDRVLERPSAPLIESVGTGAGTASPASEHVVDTMLSAVIDRLRGHGLAAHRVWLPPLDRPVPLDAVTALPNVVRGGRVDPTGLSAALAVVDRPYDQRRDALELDLAGGSGHVAVVGGPQAGKSTALCTLVLSLASRYSPRDVQFHCLDFGGGAVGRLGALPHIGSVATRTDGDSVRRIVAEIAGTVRRREELFRARGVRSMADVRSARVSDAGPDDLRIPDLVLVVDGWHTVRAEFDSLEPALQEVVSGGLSYGVHIMIAAGRWAEIRPAVKDAITSRIELRMGDPSDSDIGRARAALVPEGRPGRGITKDGLHLLIALPRTDGRSDIDDLGAATDAAIVDITRAWTHHAPASPVKLLPRRLERSDLLSVVDAPSAPQPGVFSGIVPIGLDENDLAPRFLDLHDNPHFVVLGDGRCGKTTLLRTVCMGLTEVNDAAAVRILLIDYRRTLLGEVPDDKLAGHASTAEQATEMVAELSRYLRERLPGPETTRAQLAARSWWTGPEIVVVVDDYDLVVTAHSNPLTDLLDLLARARDVGLHVVVARRCGGAARAMFEPVLARLRDLASPGLVMSGSRDEGVVLGTVRPSELPSGRGVLVGRGTATLVQTALSVTP